MSVSAPKLLLDSLPEEWDVNDAPAYRRKQICQWIFGKRASSFDEMTNLSAPLRAHLRKKYSLASLEKVRVQGSRDTTQKYLWKLRSGDFIETVSIPAFSPMQMFLFTVGLEKDVREIQAKGVCVAPSPSSLQKYTRIPESRVQRCCSSKHWTRRLAAPTNCRRLRRRQNIGNSFKFVISDFTEMGCGPNDVASRTRVFGPP